MKPNNPNTKLLASLAKRESFPGIKNLGNNCYANSILQVFNHTPAFLSYFINYTCDCKKVSNGAEGKYCYHCLLTNYVKMLVSSQSEESINPSEILKALERSDPTEFKRGNAADASECFDTVSDELKDLNQQSVMSDIYSSKLKTIYRCTSCDYTWNDRARNEGLILPKREQRECISKKLAELSSEKVSDVKRTCNKCRGKRYCTERTVIVSPPRVVKIKIAGCDVDSLGKTYFPEAINIRPCMEEWSGNEVHYELYAVVVAAYSQDISHSKESPIKINHYFALCKAQNGQWNLYNDADVYKKIPLEKVKQFDPYLLFYRWSPDFRNFDIHRRR